MLDLKSLRERVCASQADVAKRLGITTGGYARMERGEIGVPAERITDLAHIFRIPAPDLARMIAKDFEDELLRSIYVEKRKVPRE